MKAVVAEVPCLLVEVFQLIFSGSWEIRTSSEDASKTGSAVSHGNASGCEEHIIVTAEAWDPSLFVAFPHVRSLVNI